MVAKGFKHTEIGVIPEDWEVKNLCEIAFLKRGKFTPRPRNNPIYYGGNIPFVQTGDVTNSNGNIINYSQTLNDKGLGVSALFKKGTILMTIAANIGYTGVLQIDMACPDSLVAIDGFDGVSNDYLNFYFSYKRDKLDSLSTSGTQKNLNIELLSPFQIPLPPLPEQKAIAEALSDADAWIANLEQMIAKKRLIKQGAMQQLLTPPSSSSGRATEDWEVKKLGEVADIIIGLTYSPNDVRSHGTLVLRSSNVQNNKLAFENNVFVDMVLPQRVIVKEIDLLVCVRNGSKQLIGKCALIDSKTAGQAFGAFMAVVRSEYNKYIFQYFQTNHIQIQIDENLGATINQLTNKNLKEFEINFPKSLTEQTRIATILSDMDSEIESLENQLTKARQIKQGMMQELLTGRIRLNYD